MGSISCIKTLKRYFEILEQTFQNALTEQSPITQQPVHIELNLRMHQLAVLEEMRKREELLLKGYEIVHNNITQKLFSRYAVLGDPDGVGKTLMILGHISQMAFENLDIVESFTELHKESSQFLFSTSSHTSENAFNSLIVVPHTIYRQWQDIISNHTSLKAVFLKSQRDVDKEDLMEKIELSHLVLVSNTLYPSLLNVIEFHKPNTRWNRIFFDEADSLKIPQNCKKPIAKIFWFVSSNFQNLFFSKQVLASQPLRQIPEEYIQTLHPEIKKIVQKLLLNHPCVKVFQSESHYYFSDIFSSTHPLRGYTIIRCQQEFLNISLQLPPLVRKSIVCETPFTHHLISNIIPQNVEQMLNAGNIQGALETLGVGQQTPITIVDAISQLRVKEIERLERKLTFLQTENYSSQAIQSIEEKIKRHKDQLVSTQERLKNLPADTCSICFDSGTNSVVTPCCSKLFCGSCILEWMTRMPKCPLCRESFHPSALIQIGKEVKQSSLLVNKPRKYEALLSLLEENPNGKFIVFGRYDNPFLQIQSKISEKYSVGILQGNKDMIANLLQEFEKGNTNVILMNSKSISAGLNIPNATHLVFLHKMDSDEEKQILSRAYRLGRTAPLECITLLHERE